MSNCSQLPALVSYVQALAVPIIAIVVAVFGTWVAAQQMQIARDKLQHDAFGWQYDRRVAVYEATRKFLGAGFRGDISEDEIRSYGLYTLDAQFLFDDQMYKYLREICTRVTAWRSAALSAERTRPGGERTEFERMRTENLHWIIQQGDEYTGFAVKFRPFLVFKRAKRS